MGAYASELDAQIARDIVIAMIQKDYLTRDEFPESKTTADMVASAYTIIIKAAVEAKRIQVP